MFETITDPATEQTTTPYSLLTTRHPSSLARTNAMSRYGTAIAARLPRSPRAPHALRPVLPPRGKTDSFGAHFSASAHGPSIATIANTVGIPVSVELAIVLIEDLNAHPNTQAVLDAWRRLSEGQVNEDGPTTEDYPGLVGRLFVLNHIGDGDYSFRRVGYSLERLFGRVLSEHNFLSIWNEPDRQLVSAALAAASADRGPALIRARGETLNGRRVELEFVLAPLFAHRDRTARFLGLCQTMSSEDYLGGRPLRRLQAVAVFPPAPDHHPAIRIVSSR
jgi:hypothetical protein